MINILIPMGGTSSFFDPQEYHYPKHLIEVKGKTIIQRVIENYSDYKEKHFIFVINKSESDAYHLDAILKLLSDSDCEIIKLSGNTKGAACSALMAIEHIDNKEPLIIANGDQIIDESLCTITSEFVMRGLDAAVIAFESIHPKWSYIRTDNENNIVEAAEKRPLSKKAIAGFYYFKHGSDFVEAAKNSIIKDASVGGSYYVAPTLNEMVLMGKYMSFKKIDANKYHSLYSPAKIIDFEKYLDLEDTKRFDSYFENP